MATVKTIDVALRANTEHFEAGLARGSSALDRFSGNSQRAMASMDKAFHLFQKGAIQVEEYNRRIDQGEKELAAIEAGFGGMSSAVSRADAVLSGLRTETERYQSQLKELDSLKKLNVLTEAQHALAVERTTAAFNKANPPIAANKSAWQRLTSAIGPYVAAGGAAAVAHRALTVASNVLRSSIHGLANSFEEIDEANKAAISIGSTTGELLKLRFALNEVAGVGAEGVDAVLKKMNLEISQAAQTGKGATAVIESLGLSVNKLAAMSPQAAFMAITDAISQLKGVGDRTTATMALFGKGGLKLLPIFLGGAAALKESAAFAERFGFNLKQIDAQAIEQANDSLARLRAVLTGVSGQIAAELAPQIDALAKSIIGMASASNDGIANVRNSFDGLGRSIAQVLDVAMPLLELSDKLENFTLAGVMKKQAEFTAKAAAELGKFTGLLRSGGTYTQKFDEALKESRKSAADVAKEIEKRTVISAPRFDNRNEQRVGGMDQRNTLLANASGKLATSVPDKGMSTALSTAEDYLRVVNQINERHAAGLMGLRERNKLLHEATAKIQMGDHMKRFTEMQTQLRQSAQSITESVKNPFEKFTEKVSELQKLRSLNLISPETFSRAFAQAREEVGKGMENTDIFKQEAANPAALERGSQQAFSAFHANMRGQKSAEEKLLAESRTQGSTLKKIEKNTASNKVKVAAFP